MPHEIRLKLTRVLPINEIIALCGKLLDSILELRRAPELSWYEIQSGSRASVPATMFGAGDALYIAGIAGVGDLVRVGTYCDVNEEWETVPGPAVRATVQLPFGSSEMAYMFAVIVAVAIAKLNSVSMEDVSGFWLGEAGAMAMPDDFLAKLLMRPVNREKLESARQSLLNIRELNTRS